MVAPGLVLGDGREGDPLGEDALLEQAIRELHRRAPSPVMTGVIGLADPGIERAPRARS